jgi:hypothetical protein
MRLYALTIVLGVGCLLGDIALAGDACKAEVACGGVQTCGSETCCGRCGCRTACEKYCKTVCEMKEVKKTQWVVHCSEFCSTLPGGPLCAHERGCNCGACECSNGAEKCSACASLENKKYNPPKCGKVREKKTLEKKEVVCKVPSYKCVVEYCCPKCDPSLNSEGAKTPAKPDPAVPAPVPQKEPAPKSTSVAPLPPDVPDVKS